MDYLEILIRGYFSRSSRSVLDQYFLRKFHEAEDKQYTAEEFFSGCFTVIRKLYMEIDRRLHEEKRDLLKLKGMYEKGMDSTSDNPKKPTEDQIANVIEIDKELSQLNAEYFPANLNRITENKIYGQLYFSEVQYIEHSLKKAKESVLNMSKKVSNETRDEGPIIGSRVENLHPEIFKGNAFEVWQSMFEAFGVKETSRTDIRFMIDWMKKDGLIYKGVTYTRILDWINDKYELSIGKLPYKDFKKDTKRIAVYNAAKTRI